MIDGKLFTSYCCMTMCSNLYYPVSQAPALYHTGISIEATGGERTDHAHQIGNWFNYGNVNGLDFWGNGAREALIRKAV